MPNPLLSIEKKYIEDNYPCNSAKHVLRGMKLLTGIDRKEGAVWKYATEKGIRKTNGLGAYINDVEDMERKYQPMNNIKIAIKQFDLMKAMSHIDCNSQRLARKIHDLTGWSVTTDQVTEMITSTGMPAKLATVEVRRFLGL